MTVSNTFAVFFISCSLLIAHHGLPIAHEYPELTKEQLELCKHGNFHPACEEVDYGVK